jgi:hypothetical protein
VRLPGPNRTSCGGSEDADHAPDPESYRIPQESHVVVTALRIPSSSGNAKTFVALPEIRYKVAEPLGITRAVFYSALEAAVLKEHRWVVPKEVLAALKQAGSLHSKAGTCEVIRLASAADILTCAKAPQSVVDSILAKVYVVSCSSSFGGGGGASVVEQQQEQEQEQQQGQQQHEQQQHEQHEQQQREEGVEGLLMLQQRLMERIPRQQQPTQQQQWGIPTQRPQQQQRIHSWIPQLQRVNPAFGEKVPPEQQQQQHRQNKRQHQQQQLHTVHEVVGEEEGEEEDRGGDRGGGGGGAEEGMECEDDREEQQQQQQKQKQQHRHQQQPWDSLRIPHMSLPRRPTQQQQQQQQQQRRSSYSYSYSAGPPPRSLGEGGQLLCPPASPSSPRARRWALGGTASTPSRTRRRGGRAWAGSRLP